ncbi:MerR family transcriptional regulator [Enterovirga aerilata]|uniref:Helix-turn-helix domain-containing protein n=1 Tax=Enterovirga aerilata TaxID=2730920 RepID=A0A849I3F3_9HYPH|nr:helix-turn-helix domain-containing protein [Enterovirga sp. DB1703]NNM73942.1 helix-turn-helix domain-containing protein [Enterovirga sp. DB1703]
MLAIGGLSKRTGVNIETIRYYERVGMLPKAPRAENGRRVYDEGDVGRLAFIRHAREFGFGLPAIRSLLALQERPDMPCEAAADLARTQLVEVERRIVRLSALKAELARMIDACEGGCVSECRVVEALAAGSNLPN